MAFLKNLFEMTSIPATSNASIHLMAEAAYQVIVSILGLVRNARNNGLRIQGVSAKSSHLEKHNQHFVIEHVICHMKGNFVGFQNM